jgi:acyl carrier protein
MTNKEKIKLIEDALELDENTLTEEMVLEDVDGFDSMGKLTLIVLCEDDFGKKLTPDQLMKFVIIKDILDFMG